jgi:hypothetical protein
MSSLAEKLTQLAVEVEIHESFLACNVYVTVDANFEVVATGVYGQCHDAINTKHSDCWLVDLHSKGRVQVKAVKPYTREPVAVYNIYKGGA